MAPWGSACPVSRGSAVVHARVFEVVLAPPTCDEANAETSSSLRARDLEPRGEYDALMNARRVLTRGGLEFCIGLIWFAFSFAGWAWGRIGVGALLVDTLALGALLLGVFRPLAGLVAASAVVVLALFADPQGLGMCHYIALCALIPAIRRGHLKSSAAASAVVGGTVAATMLRRNGSADGIVAAVIATPALVGIAWLVGLAFRWIAQAEADRLSRHFAERQLHIATDIHNFVSRNLTSLLAQAESDRDLVAAHPEFAGELVTRLRQSSLALRGVTQDLQLTRSTAPLRAGPVREVLEAEVIALRTVGFAVEVTGEGRALDDLPEDADFAAGRILAEALHNVLKHGDTSEPCHVTVDRTPGELRVAVRNKVAKRGRRGSPASLGLTGMARHAALAEGAVASGRSGAHHWECAAVFPLPNGASERSWS